MWGDGRKEVRPLTAQELVARLDEISELRQQVREVTTQYDGEAKLVAAEYLGMPGKAFFGLPFAQWCDVKDYYTKVS